jgi:hypothetical protein
MGLLFQSDERRDFVAMVEEVTERVENLGLRQSQGLGDLGNRFAKLMERRHVSDSDAQAVNHRLAAANAFQPNDMGTLSLHGVNPGKSSEEKDTK